MRHVVGSAMVWLALAAGCGDASSAADDGGAVDPGLEVAVDVDTPDEAGPLDGVSDLADLSEGVAADAEDVEQADDAREDDGSPPCPEGWHDPASGLCWQDPPDPSGRNWLAAVAYCDGLSLGGHGTGVWRLPSIDELRSLVRGCAGGGTGGGCGVTDACLAYSCLTAACSGCDELAGPGAGGCYWPAELGGTCDVFWSSSLYTDGSTFAWYVYFDYGSLYYMDHAPTYQVRCVRDLS